MKLSRIIELALIRHYGEGVSQDQFLCNAVYTLFQEKMLSKNQKDKATLCIEALLLRIYPEVQCYTLVDALFRKGHLPNKEVYSNLNYTTQLYVWWVFDLKNKGL